MNLHPLLVHFPIALLMFYAVLELVPFKRIREKPYFFYVKASLVIAGALGAFAAYLAGDAIEEEFSKIASLTSIIEVHATFALATLLLFSVLAFCHLIVWIEREWTTMPEKFRVYVRLFRHILESPLAPIAALIGLGLVTVTGALGGAIAFGPEVDPASAFFYKLFTR